MQYRFLIFQVFVYFFKNEVKSDFELPHNNNELVEWIYLIIGQIFSQNFDSFEIFKQIFSFEKNNFHDLYYQFFSFLLHVFTKIIENREQNSVIKELYDKYQQNEKNSFLVSEKNENFSLFLIKLVDISRLICYFNELNQEFLKNIEKISNNNCENKLLLNQQLNFLNIWIKVNIFLNYFLK